MRAALAKAELQKEKVVHNGERQDMNVFLDNAEKDTGGVSDSTAELHKESAVQCGVLSDGNDSMEIVANDRRGVCEVKAGKQSKGITKSGRTVQKKGNT